MYKELDLMGFSFVSVGERTGGWNMELQISGRQTTVEENLRLGEIAGFQR